MKNASSAPSFVPPPAVAGGPAASGDPAEGARYPYDGPADRFEAIDAALREVVDPEIGLSVVEIGLVYGVTLRGDAAEIRLTTTSAACPVAETLADDVAEALGRVLRPHLSEIVHRAAREAAGG